MLRVGVGVRVQPTAEGCQTKLPLFQELALKSNLRLQALAEANKM